jgi:hypothetical protein
MEFKEVLAEKGWDGLLFNKIVRGQLKYDGICTETRFCLSAKQTSPLKSAGASVHSTTGRRGVRISSSNAGYTMFQGSVNGTGYPLHSPVSPSLPLPCITVCHHISTGVYYLYVLFFNILFHWCVLSFFVVSKWKCPLFLWWIYMITLVKLSYNKQYILLQNIPYARARVFSVLYSQNYNCYMLLKLI